MTTNIDYHPITGDEQHQQAIDLWHQIFPNCLPGFYKRYYTAVGSSYHEGDTLGAWCDGRLVSTVHICRLVLRNGNETYLCGGIANVATVPEFRGRGISRHLLEQAINKMKNDGFHMSILHSARDSHYTYVGFEQYNLNRPILIDLNRNIDDKSISLNFDWTIADINDEIINIYAKQPRPLQLDRSPEYFKGWVEYNWKFDNALIHIIPEKGYIILNKDKDHNFYYISEWRAINRDIEEQLLIQASSKVQQLNSKQIQLVATPLFVDQKWIEKHLGTIVKIEKDELYPAMIRNINLSIDQFENVKSLYLTGKATMWPADFF